MRSWVGAVHRVGDGSDAFTKPLTVALPSCGLCDGATDLTTLRSERGSFKSTVHGCILGCFFGSSCITSCVHKDLQLSSNCPACVAGAGRLHEGPLLRELCDQPNWVAVP